MNTEDVSESGLQQGQFVDLTSHYKGRRASQTLHGRSRSTFPVAVPPTYFQRPRARVD